MRVLHGICCVNLRRSQIRISPLRFLFVSLTDRPAHRVCPSREVSLLPVHQRAEYSHGLFQIVQLRHSPREHKYRAHRRLVVTRYDKVQRVHHRADVRTDPSHEPQSVHRVLHSEHHRGEYVYTSNHKYIYIKMDECFTQTFRAKFHARVVLPPHLEGDELTVQLIGESCVPEVAITEPIHAIRETPCLNFPRTLIDEGTCKYFTLENVGFIKAKVIVEIMEDPNNVFTFFPCPDTQHLLQILEEYCNGCSIIYLFISIKDMYIYIYIFDFIFLQSRTIDAP